MSADESIFKPGPYRVRHEAHCIHSSCPGPLAECRLAECKLAPNPYPLTGSVETWRCTGCSAERQGFDPGMNCECSPRTHTWQRLPRPGTTIINGGRPRPHWTPSPACLQNLRAARQVAEQARAQPGCHIAIVGTDQNRARNVMAGACLLDGDDQEQHPDVFSRCFSNGTVAYTFAVDSRNLRNFKLDYAFVDAGAQAEPMLTHLDLEPGCLSVVDFGQTLTEGAVEVLRGMGAGGVDPAWASGSVGWCPHGVEGCECRLAPVLRWPIEGIPVPTEFRVEVLPPALPTGDTLDFHVRCTGEIPAEGDAWAAQETLLKLGEIIGKKLEPVVQEVLTRPSCNHCADLQLCRDSDRADFAEAITTAHADRKLAEKQARLNMDEVERLRNVDRENRDLRDRLEDTEVYRDHWYARYVALMDQQAALRATAGRWTRRAAVTLGALSLGATIGYGVQHWGWRPDIRVAVVLAALFALPRVWGWLQRCAAEEEARQNQLAEGLAEALCQGVVLLGEAYHALIHKRDRPPD